MEKDRKNADASSDVRVTHRNMLWLLYRILADDFSANNIISNYKAKKDKKDK